MERCSASQIFSLVQFSHSVVSDSMKPHGLQHTRLHSPSPTSGACLNSCPLSQWSHPTILSSVIPFSSCLQSFPASGSLPMSQFFPSGGQSVGFIISSSNEHPGLISFRMDWLDLLAVQRTLKSLLQHHSSTKLPNYWHRTVHNIPFLSHLLAVFYRLAVSQLCSGSDYIHTPTTNASHCLLFYFRGS